MTHRHTLSLSIDAFDLSSRAKRRVATKFASALLERVRLAEQGNIDSFPLNLQYSDAFANAEHSFDCLTDAIVTLMDAY